MIEGSKITVGELVGEISAEVTFETTQMTSGRFDSLDHGAWIAVLDVAKGVIARHIGKEIIDDDDYPARPLPDRIKAKFGQ